jgi:ABC-type antimicrobial peptide transport system permease subunit
MHGVPLKYSLRNLWRRPVRTLLTLLGLAVLVALIVFLTAFGRSFGRAIRLPGDPQNLIVLSKKAQSFDLSSIKPSELDVMAAAVVDQLQPGPDGEPLFSKEVFHYVRVTLSTDPEQTPRRGLMHGIEPHLAESVLQGFRVIEGHLPESSENQIVVGKNAANRLKVTDEQLRIGAEVKFGDEAFTVVGVFEAPGTLYENWLLTDVEDLTVALDRNDYSFARMRVQEGVDLDAMATELSLDERYESRVLRETEYFADFAEGFSHFQQFAVLVAVVLGIGGVLTGMNTLHNSVAGRIREIGTLRVLGFGKLQVYLAFLIEALVLTGLAGLVGCLIGLSTNGWEVTVPVAATFPVRVDAPALLIGLGAAVAMGFLGLLFPMLRALGMPAVEAVRAS